jgi:hypothetical protein
MILVSYFEKFVSNIQPSKERVEAVSDAHTTLRKHLIEDAKLEYPIETSFLGGSYARHTALDPIKDADIIIVLERKDVSDDKTEPSPRTVLHNLRKAIDEFYDNVNLETQRRSIQVLLEEDDVRMDIVPSIAPNSKDAKLYVPDYEQAKWIESNPSEHLSFATKKNKDSGGRFVRVVKSIKWWKSEKLQKQRAPKSFLLETIVAHNMDSKSTSVCEAFQGTLRNILDAYADSRKSATLPEISDPGLPSNDLAKSCRWTVADFIYFHDQLEELQKVVEDANATTADKDATIRLWQSVLGDVYPSSLTEEEEKRFAAPTTEDVATKSRYAYFVRLSATLHKSQGGPYLQKYPSDGFKIAKKLWLRFLIDETNVPEPFEIKWSVINHGAEARRALQLRRVSMGGREHWESTQFRGHHFMDCIVFKNGKQLARARYVVNII